MAQASSAEQCAKAMCTRPVEAEKRGAPKSLVTAQPVVRSRLAPTLGALLRPRPRPRPAHPTNDGDRLSAMLSSSTDYCCTG
jgi:hypothetical protein